jgi:hypothetical protein
MPARPANPSINKYFISWPRRYASALSPVTTASIIRIAGCYYTAMVLKIPCGMKNA